MHMDNLMKTGEVLNITLAKLTNFVMNDCRYSSFARDTMVNWVHPLFLKSKATAIREDTPNLW